MGSKVSHMLAAVALLWVMSAAAAPRARAITCGQVAQGIFPCRDYVTGRAPLTPYCCNGIRAITAGTVTTADRRTACTCLKNLARAIGGLNLGLAAGLPGKCGVRSPFPISFNTDCNTLP